MGPNVYIIAGPNGAGKTTFARQFLPTYAQCKNFVNADLIAQGVAPFSPEAAAFRAGRLMLDEIAGFAKRRLDFGFETTLAGRAHLELIRGLQKQGYAAHFFFLWLPSAELAITRVKDRVAKGGHDVPNEVVRRRFDRSAVNFFRYYRHLADSWFLFDNSGSIPEVIAIGKQGGLDIIQKELYKKLILPYEARK